MLPCNVQLFAFICAILPSVVLARRGGGGGGGGGGGDSLSSLSLEPIVAAIFAFCVIFAVLTALQAIQAVDNIRRRIIRQPPSITLLEFSVGPVFPTFLLLSTLMLTTTYALRGTYWALEYNQNTFDPPDFTEAYFGAAAATRVLANIFLASGILALISNREKTLVHTSRTLRDIKMIADAVLTIILLALSMSYIRVSLASVTRADARTAENIYIAYISFFLLTVVNIAISSMVLYVRSRHSPTNDHKVRALKTSVFFNSLTTPLLRRLLYAWHSSFLLSSSSMRCTLLWRKEFRIAISISS